MRRKLHGSYLHKITEIAFKQKMKRTHLKEKAGISSSRLVKLGKDEDVSLERIERKCFASRRNIDKVGNVIDLTQNEVSNGKS